jgi:hypothetical protein
MEINELKNQWQKSYEETLLSIENHLRENDKQLDDEKKCVMLAKWLLTTNVSGYDFMPKGYENYRSTPYEAEYLLNLIHHALVDDGEICFVTLKLENKELRNFMMFYPSDLDNFEEECYKENEELINGKIESIKRSNRILQKMIDAYPDKGFNLRKEINKEDFKFEIYRDVSVFMNKVEELDKNYKEEMKKSEEKRDEMTKKMKLN